MHYAPVSVSFGLFLSVRLPLVTLLTSLQSGNFAIFKNTRVFFFSFLFFIICLFTQIMHLFHVRFCQTANFDYDAQSGGNMSAIVLQVCSKRRGYVSGSELSPLCPIMSAHQLWLPNTDWCCYFYCHPTVGVT